MYAKKSRYLPLILVLAVLLLSFLIGNSMAKYIYRNSWTATVTFNAQLADSITLQEHKAERLADGSYVLTATVVKENTYTLIPGLDILKDPYITITGKSSIASYLFLTVTDNLGADSGVTYSLADCWKPLGDSYPNVYVYSDANGPIEITDETAGLENINIIKDNTIYVSQELDKDLSEVQLRFSVVLNEIGTVTENSTKTLRTAEQVYKNVTPTN